MENIEDPTNLTGISKLLNKQHVNNKIDLEALERDMIGGNVKKVKVSDPAREFKARMQEINRTSGMEIVDVPNIPSVSSGPGKFRKPSPAPATSRSTSGSESGSESGSGSGSGLVSFSGSASPESGSDSDNDSDELMRVVKGKQPKSQHNIQPITGGLRPLQPTQSIHHSRPTTYQMPAQQVQQVQQVPVPVYYQQMAPPPQQLPAGTPLDQAMQAYAGNTMDYGLDSREDEEEKKSELLEDIDELKYELEDDDVDLSRIPEVNQDSTIDEIYSVRKILRRKYDRRRFNSFGTEFILAFAQGVEYICNGERKVGNVTLPDLTNWHNTVRTKLRKLRYETSTIVSGTMERFNIGPVGRLGLELVPSAFLHSKMRKDQKGKANYTTNQMSAAYDQLSQYDD